MEIRIDFKRILTALVTLSLIVSPFAFSVEEVFAVTCEFGSDIGGGQCRGYITNTGSTTWSVPSDWNSSSNTIEVIGAGGGGRSVATFLGEAGGGGGAYAKILNATLTSGASVGIKVGSGGGANTDGGDTYLCSSTSNCASIGGSAVIVGAKGGLGGNNGGTGGSTASSVGTTKYAGGNGGATGGHVSGEGGSGGGGAAGPNGAGANGGSNSDSGTRTLFGGGGGGNGGGYVGHSIEVDGNHNGGNNYSNTGGGAGGGVGGSAGNGTAGAGGGGGGFAGNGGGTGGDGQDWDSTHGSGGGGGGGSENDGVGAGSGGLYGGGGGGVGPEGSQVAGSGAQGIIVITYTPSAGDPAPTTLSRPKNNLGLAGYWSFDEATSTIAHDFSGRGNTGTIANTSNPSTATSGWNSGKRGKAITLDGSNDTFTVSSYSAMSPGTSDFSISFWMKTSNVGDVLMASSGGNAGTFTTGFGLVVPDAWACSSSAKLYFNMANGTTRDASICSNSAVTDGTWKHVVVVVDRGDNLKIYINGVLDNTVTSTLTGSVTFTDFVSGSVDWQSAFAGSLDDMRLYHRALSATEVSSIYRSGQTIIGGGERTKVTGDLAGYWTFNGKDISWSTNRVSDSSGNGNLGTLTNMSTTSSPVQGKIGQGLYFDGSNDFISFGNKFNFGASSPFTISIWFKASASGSRMLFDKRGDTTNWLRLALSSGSAVLEIANSYPTNYKIITSAGTYNDGKWHMVTATRTSAGALTLYVDGVSVGTASGGNFDLTNSYGFNIGKTEDGGGVGYFLGSLDEARVYNRSLTASEVKQLYGIGVGTVIRQ